eukprot:354756-Chlamydomonas_euryale.AAC.5
MWAATGLPNTARVCHRVRCHARYAVVGVRKGRDVTSTEGVIQKIAFRRPFGLSNQWEISH